MPSMEKGEHALTTHPALSDQNSNVQLSIKNPNHDYPHSDHEIPHPDYEFTDKIVHCEFPENYAEQEFSERTSLTSSLSKNTKISIDFNRLASVGVNYFDPDDLSCWHRCVHKVKNIYTKFGLKHLVPVLVLALYSLIGAGAFYALESGHETQILSQNKQQIEAARKQMAERMWEIKLENLTRRKVLIYSLEALKWYDELTQNIELTERQWDFWGAIFYCGTIYTTIGYGNIVPKTFGGKLVTLFYAAFGIPLVFFILNDLGDVLGTAIYRVWTKFKRIFQCDKKSAKGAALDDDTSVRSMATTTAEFANVHDLPMSVALGITLAWMFLCSAVFCSWEDWDYFQAFHFFFVSLTTVGLGDTVPRHHNYMIMSFGLILLGLSLVSMCIQVVQAKVEYLAQQILEKLMKRYQIGQFEDGELRAADLIEKTLDQEHAPSWIRALLSRKKKAKLMKEWRKRVKVRIVGTQTDWHGGRKIQNSCTQTDSEPDWKAVYEKKLSTAQDLLKELEQRYGTLIRDQKGKITRASIRRSTKNLDSADETINAIKSAISRVPSTRMSSLREKFRLRRRSGTMEIDYGDNSEQDSDMTITEDGFHGGSHENLEKLSLQYLDPSESKNIDFQVGNFSGTRRKSVTDHRPKKTASKWRWASRLALRKFSLQAQKTGQSIRKYAQIDRKSGRFDQKSERSGEKFDWIGQFGEKFHRSGQIGETSDRFDQSDRKFGIADQGYWGGDHGSDLISDQETEIIEPGLENGLQTDETVIDIDQIWRNPVDFGQKPGTDLNDTENFRTDQIFKTDQLVVNRRSSHDHRKIDKIDSNRLSDRQAMNIDQYSDIDYPDRSKIDHQLARTIDQAAQKQRFPDKIKQISLKAQPDHLMIDQATSPDLSNTNYRLYDMSNRSDIIDKINQPISTDQNQRRIPTDQTDILIDQQSQPGQIDQLEKSPMTKTVITTDLVPAHDFIGLPSLKSRSIIVVEENVEESILENRSAITRWICRFVPSKSTVKKRVISVGVQTTQDVQLLENDNDQNGVCPMCRGAQKKESDQSHEDVDVEDVIIIPMEDVGLSTETLGVHSVASTGVQVSGLMQTRFIRVPYQLDDCKVMFGVIRKRLLECQSILNREDVEKDGKE